MATVSEQAILDSVRQIPVERWGEVLRLLEAMKPSGPAIRTAAELAGSDAVGLWADRDDLGDGHEFARRLRAGGNGPIKR